MQFDEVVWQSSLQKVHNLLYASLINFIALDAKRNHLVLEIETFKDLGKTIVI